MFLMFGLAVILAGKTRVCVFHRPPRFPALLTRHERSESATIASNWRPPPWLARAFQNPPAGDWRQGRGGRPWRAAAPKPRANRRAPGGAGGATREKIEPRSGETGLLAAGAHSPARFALCGLCRRARRLASSSGEQFAARFEQLAARHDRYKRAPWRHTAAHQRSRFWRDAPRSLNRRACCAVSESIREPLDGGDAPTASARRQANRPGRSRPTPRCSVQEPARRCR